MIEELAETRQQRVAIWSCAYGLGDAWITFGNRREKDLQAKARGTPASLVYLENLTAEIFGKVADGELIAVGYRLAPTLSDGPVFIPADMFSEPSRDGWLEGEVQASGWQYERVRVLEPRAIEKMLSPTSQMVVGSQPALSIVGVDTSMESDPTLEPRKRGPKSGEAELRRIYKLLLSNDSITKAHSVKEAHRAVVQFIESTPSHHFPRGRGIAYSTFARAISAKSRT